MKNQILNALKGTLGKALIPALLLAVALFFKTVGQELENGVNPPENPDKDA